MKSPSKRRAKPKVEADDVEFDASGSYDAYVEYNKILRTWFVAFGVGGPALFLVQGSIAERLVKAGELRFVATLFLLGAASQVLGAFINKLANWYVYWSVENPGNPTHWKYRASEWLVEQFWIDILLDAITIVSFTIAVWQMLTAFAPAT